MAAGDVVGTDFINKFNASPASPLSPVVFKRVARVCGGVGEECVARLATAWGLQSGNEVGRVLLSVRMCLLFINILGPPSYPHNGGLLGASFLCS